MIQLTPFRIIVETSSVTNQTIRSVTATISVVAASKAGSSGANAIAGAIVDASVTATNRLALTAMEKHTSNTAQALHWRAYQEQFFLANKAFADGSGPATDIVKEILRRRAHCVFGGQYDWRRIIQEPAGWLVIHDKISLL